MTFFISVFDMIDFDMPFRHGGIVDVREVENFATEKMLMLREGLMTLAKNPPDCMMGFENMDDLAGYLGKVLSAECNLIKGKPLIDWPLPAAIGKGDLKAPLLLTGRLKSSMPNWLKILNLEDENDADKR